MNFDKESKSVFFFRVGGGGGGGGCGGGGGGGGCGVGGGGRGSGPPLLLQIFIKFSGIIIQSFSDFFV